MLKLWMLLAAAGLAAAVGFGSGWKVRDAFCDAAYWKAENAKNVAALRTASLGASLSASLQTELDTERDKTDELQRAFDAAPDKGACVTSAGDALRLNRILRGGD